MQPETVMAVRKKGFAANTRKREPAAGHDERQQHSQQCWQHNADNKVPTLAGFKPMCGLGVSG